MDGDGLADVLAVNGSAHSGSPGQFLYVIDPRNGAVTWKSQALNAYASSPHIADVGAPGMDLLAIVGGKVTRVRWSDKQQLTSVDSNYTSIVPMDITGTPELEIVAGRADGRIDVLDGETLQPVGQQYLNACAGNPVNSLVAQGASVVAFICGSALTLYDLVSAAPVTSTDTGLTWAGTNGSLVNFISNAKSAYFVGGEWPAVFLDVGGNHQPTVQQRNVSVHWRSSVDLQLTGNDADGDALSFQVMSLPAFGT